jgi:hypothetical protein
LSWPELRRRISGLRARLRARRSAYLRRSRAFFHAGPAQRLIMYAILVLAVIVFFIGYGGQMSAWASGAVITTVDCLRHPVKCVREVFGLPTPEPTPTATPGPTPYPTQTPMPMPVRLPEAADEKVQSWTTTENLRRILVLGLTIWLASGWRQYTWAISSTSVISRSPSACSETVFASPWAGFRS